MAPEELDLLVVEGAFLQYLGGTQLVAAVDVSDGVHDASEVVSFIHGGVATADYNDVLAPEKVAVANRAVGDASPGIFILAGGAQLVVGAAGGDDEALRSVAAVVGVDSLDRLISLLDALHFRVINLGAEAGGLLFPYSWPVPGP